jgi:hypothetical protein
MQQLVFYRQFGRLFAGRYCTTRQRFNLPGALPSNKDS